MSVPRPPQISTDSIEASLKSVNRSGIGISSYDQRPRTLRGSRGPEFEGMSS